MPAVELFMTDFCPFAQRAWIAFLEKEKDPYHPILFNYKEVNYFNPDLPLTKEFLALHPTVPAGRYGDVELRESLPIAYWVDETFKQNPLQPATPEGVEKMKALITKFTSGEFDVTGLFYKLLFTTDETAEAEATRATLKTQLLRNYAELSKELAASGGPYLLGQQFTIADIALIPFVDRAQVLLGHYRNIKLPETQEYAALHAWRESYAKRPSHLISNADRLQRSIEKQPFEKTKRNEYIIEVYAGYGLGLKDEIRAQLRNAPPGKATQNIEAAREEKAKKQAAAAAKQAEGKTAN